MKKEYSGTCYIGVVGSEIEVGECRDSINAIRLQQGDAWPRTIRATKGFEARQMHFEKWLSGKHDFMLLLDADMIFPPDTLERLRSHRLPYVSGFYMRRRYAPLAPVWFEPWSGHWPYMPWSSDPERGKLHKIGASGWGCMLIHREVAEAVKPLLKGEAFVAEDDIDVMPYHLPTIMQAIEALSTLTTEKPSMPTLLPALTAHVEILRSEIIPVRWDKSNVGSDLRFPFFALKAGYQLWGDPEVRCGHMLNYPLSPDDYSAAPPDVRTGLRESLKQDARRDRAQLKAARQ